MRRGCCSCYLNSVHRLTSRQSFYASVISVFELASPPPSRAQQNSISAVLSKCRFMPSFAPASVTHPPALSTNHRLCFACPPVAYRTRDRAKDSTPDAAAPAPAAAAVSAAAAAAAATSAIAPTPSPAAPKRPRDDEPAAAVGGAARQKQSDGTAWDWVRVHRVGTAGESRLWVPVAKALLRVCELRCVCLGKGVWCVTPTQVPAAHGCVCPAPLQKCCPKYA